MSGYIGTQPVPQATQTRDAFTATSNQTSFATSGYTPEFLDVFLNGVKLAASDYTATNGSDVVLASGAAASDILEVVAYSTFDSANVTGATNFTVTGAFTSQGIDDNGNATALTIDSSENVLVGKTTIGIANVGGELRADGQITGTKDGGAPLALNRKTSDGDIALFQKDGGTVGSIGSAIKASSRNIYIGSTNTGLYFFDGVDAISPVNPATGSDRDNAIDLGRSNVRFKDLYLSSSVKLPNCTLEDQVIKSNTFIFKNGAGTTEYGRFDSSGNLLVGNTVANPASGFSNQAGFGYTASTGVVEVATTANTAPMEIGKNNANDGQLIALRKQGTTIGSIGVAASDNLYIAGGSGNTKGLYFSDGGTVPANTGGAPQDGTSDLGAPTVRFKDAYLSGGIYLGGAGSANKLDDYEEGTFTPQWDGYAPANSQGRYTKIGNQVIVHAHLVTNTSADYSGVKINNLPFTSSNVAGVGAGMTWCDNTYFYDFVTHTRVYPNSTQCVLNLVHNGAIQAMEYVGRTPQIGGSGTFRWTIIYQTDA